MKNLTFTAILLVLSAGHLSAVAIQTAVTGDDRNRFSEELHITTDRDFYAAGEKIWMKVWKINSLTRTPDRVSRVVYAEILDLENNPVAQIKIGTEGSSGSAVIVLPDTLRTGSYIIRAYTSWMENFSPDLFAFRTISVINPFDKLTNILVPPTGAVPDSMHFYPEGGQLISQIETRLGIRASGRKGQPLPVKGAIIDHNNDTVSVFRTGPGGYGIISLKPAGPGELFAVAGSGTGKKVFRLPPVEDKGMNLISARQDDPRSAAILRVNQSFDPSGKRYFLSIVSNGLAPSKREIEPGAGQSMTISRDLLPAGISFLSVTDENDRQLTGRWISNDRLGGLGIKVSTSEARAGRGKVRLEISTTDLKGRALPASLSVSVTKTVTKKQNRPGLSAFRQMEGMDIISDDCNSNDPDDYLLFRHPDENGSNSLAPPDPGMLKLPEIDGHLVSGSIREKSSGDPLRNAALTMSTVGKAAHCLFTRTDSNGNFNFVTSEQGKKEIVIQPLKPEAETYIDLSNPFLPGRASYIHPPVSIDSANIEAVNNMLISMQVSSIYEPFARTTPGNKDQQVYNFYGRPDNSLLMSKFIELTSVKEIVAELIPGVSTVRSGGKTGFRLTKAYQTKPFEEGPMVLVDGIPVSDIDKVISIPSNEIEKVDVLIDRYYISGNILCGIIHFITGKGNLSVMEADKSVFRMEYDLLSTGEKFHSPDYSSTQLRESRIPDFRNCLYWNPELLTGTDGKAEVEFFTSDETTGYIITVEGLTDDGKGGSVSLPFVTGTSR